MPQPQCPPDMTSRPRAMPGRRYPPNSPMISASLWRLAAASSGTGSCPSSSALARAMAVASGLPDACQLAKGPRRGPKPAEGTAEAEEEVEEETEKVEDEAA